MNHNRQKHGLVFHFTKKNTLTGAVYGILVLLFLCTMAASAQPYPPLEIWVTPTGSGGGLTASAPQFHTGAADDPISTPDADTFFDFINDQLWVGTNGVGTNTFTIPEFSTIHLMPGTFHVRDGHTTAGGAREPITLKQGWHVRGAGMDVTVVQLLTNDQAVAPTIFVISGSALTANPGGNFFDGPLTNAEVSDLTVDCNLQNQSQPQSIDAVNFAGSRNTIRRVKAINWGSTISGSEVFVIAQGGHNNLPLNDSLEGLTENCIVVQPAQVIHKCDSIAITATSSPGETRKGAWKIRGCVVRDVTSGNTIGEPAGFAAFGGGNDTEVSDCTAFNLSGTADATYDDSIVSHDVIYRNNKFINVNNGIVYNGSS